MADSANPTGGPQGGPESQGVSFVLSVQDFGSDILSKADKAYTSLLGTMRNVAQQSDKFVSELMSKMTQTAAIDKANGGVAPIITPFTLSQKALDLMPKFAKASIDWLKNSASGMAQWATEIGIAGSRTRDFRDALAQSEIEGKRFTDQFAGVGGLIGQVLGNAIGKTAAAAGGALGTATVAGIYGYSELYEKMHEVGIMQGWNTEQTQKATQHYLSLANALNLNVDSMASIAHSMSEAHIPLTQANEDLLKFAATAVEVSKIKPGGAVTDDSIAGAIGNMIKIQKFNAQQVAAFMVETTEQVKHSSLTWVDALNLVGPAAQENFDQMFKGLSDVDKASRVSHLLPQIMAWGAAAKDANVPMEVLQNVLHGLQTENSPEFQHLAALIGSTGHNLISIQQRLKGGDLTGGLNELQASVSQFMNSNNSNATQEFFKSFNSLFGEGTALRIANMAKVSHGIDLTSASMENLNKMRATQLSEKFDTPQGQLELVYKNLKDFWKQIGATDNPQITSDLKTLNGYLKDTFSYVGSHPDVAHAIFQLGLLGSALGIIKTAFLGLQFLGITKVFSLMAELASGTTTIMAGLASEMGIAQISAAALGVSIAAISGGLLAIYELFKHKDFVEAWGKKIIGDGTLNKYIPGFVDNKTTYDSKDIQLKKHLQEMLGYEPDSGKSPDNSPGKTDPEQAKQTALLQGIHQHTKETADAAKKQPPIKTSKLTEDQAYWNYMESYMQ